MTKEERLKAAETYAVQYLLQAQQEIANKAFIKGAEAEAESIHQKNFTEEQMIYVLRCAIKGFYEWLKSDDCFIQDKETHIKITNAEINSTRKSIVKNYIIPELEKEGIEFRYKDETPPLNQQ